MNTGEILFRIEDIQKLELLKREPEIGYKYTEYTEEKTSTETKTSQ